MAKGTAPQKTSEVLQGTLDLMVLKTLDALGPLHGYGIARRIEQLSQEVLHFGMGRIGKQSPGAVLLDYPQWSKAARQRDGKLGTHCSGNRPGPAPRR
jgi:hypothetical protein